MYTNEEKGALWHVTEVHYNLHISPSIDSKEIVGPEKFPKYP